MKQKKIFIIAAILVLALGALIFFTTVYVAPVIMYHSVDGNDQVSKLSISPKSFSRQMEFLKKNKYNVVSLEKLASYMRSGERMPPKTIAITFDDGFYNNYQYAYPVLKKYGLPATIFVIVSKIGKPGYLGWKEIKEMSDSGLITIGSHTMSHLWLPAMGTKQLKYELERSREILESRTGRSVTELCYPVGAHDDRVKAAAAAAGYACAVATNPGRAASAGDIYAIKRVRISRTSDNLFVFWVETSGYYTWIKEQRDD